MSAVHIAVYVAQAYKWTSTYVFTDAGARASTEYNHRPLHSQHIAFNPAVRIEFVGVRSEDILVVLYDGAVDTDAVAFREMESRDKCSARGDESGHCETDAGMETHAFVDARFKIRKFDRFCIGDRHG